MTNTPPRPHGCHNRKAFKATVVVQQGWRSFQDFDSGERTRTPIMKDIPNPMSKDCQYTLHKDNHADPRCDGCFWKYQPPIAVLAA